MSLSSLIKSIEGGEILSPIIKKFLLNERRGITKGLKDRDALVIEDARLSRKALYERILEYQKRKVPINGEFFHPSSLGSCMRQVWFSAVDAPRQEIYTGESVLRDYLTLETGTYTHIMFQNLCERAGVLKQREVEIKDADERLIGHTDGILDIERDYVLEIKTINGRQFTSLGKESKDAHKKQMHAYMKVLDIPAAIIMYLEKNLHHVKEFIVPFEEGYYQKQVAPRVNYFFKSLRRNIMPFREGSNPKKFPCSWCPFIRVCWDSNETKKFLRARGAKEEK